MTSNVLLISLDTLRGDVAYSGRFPTIERLRREGTSFRHAVSSSPLTPPSHATVLTGLQPARHGIRHLLREQLNTGVPTLATYLRASQYTPAAIVASPGLNRWYGLNRDFASYNDEVPRLADGRDPVEVADVKIRGTALKRAPVVVQRTLEWLKRRKPERYFLFVHFFDAHWPYEPPEDFGLRVANPYEGEVAYMDHYLGVLLDELESIGYSLDDTLVVLFSDHGEDLGGWYANDHAGERGHPEENGHGCLLFDTTQLVPLVMRMPDSIPAGQDIETQVRLVDVAPTVMELVGLEVPALDGASLRTMLKQGGGEHRLGYSETFYPEEMDEPAKPAKAVRIANRYKVVWQVGGERVDVYDLHADPCETTPVGSTDSAAALLHAG